MAARLFTYAAIFTPNEKEKKDGGKPELIIEPTHILANSENEANMVAIRAIPDEYVSCLEQVEVAVRPF